MNNKVKLFFEDANEYLSGIEKVKDDLYFDIALSKKEADYTVCIVEKECDYLSLDLNNNRAVIAFGSGKVKLFRGIMLLAEAINEGKKSP